MEGTESRQRFNFKKEISWPRRRLTRSAGKAGFQARPADLRAGGRDAHESKYYLESCCGERWQQPARHQEQNGDTTMRNAGKDKESMNCVSRWE